MTSIAEYRAALRGLTVWDPYLLAHSGLPGPRGNIELGMAAAEEGNDDRFSEWLAWDADRAPTGSPQEFLAFCGVLGLGRLAAEGDRTVVPVLRRCASDSRWRVREGVAMAVQRLAGRDWARACAEMERWARGNWLEQRAAVASLSEPGILSSSDRVAAVLALLDTVTAHVAEAPPGARIGEAFRALRKGLGYAWSVVVAADPPQGKPEMEAWVRVPDRDVRWIMRQNLSKKRLERVDPGWVTEQRRLVARA